MALKAAIIGAGEIAKRAHAPGYLQAGADVVALCSRPGADLDGLAAAYHIERCYHDWRRLLDDGGFDVVSICTPPALHAEMAVECARRGVHVLVEKPMALSADECDRMIAAAAQAGVVLMAAHNQRFIRLHQAVKALIESGSLGQPYLAHAVFGHGGPENWSPSQDWYFRPDQGGHGVLADLGAHKFDLLSWLLDQRIVEVGAMAHTFEKPAATIDTVACTLRFSGDTLATVQLSWTFRPDWENSLVIRCARGVVRVPTDASASAEALIVDKDGGQRLLSLDGSADDSAGWLATVAAFCAAVEQGAPSPVSGEDGRAVVAALDAAFEALSSRRVVPVG